MQIKSSNINIQKFQKRNIDKEYLYFLNYKNSFESFLDVKSKIYAR